MLYDLNGTGQDVHLRMTAMALNSYCVPSKLMISISRKKITVILFLLNMLRAAAQELVLTESRSLRWYTAEYRNILHK